MFRRPFAAVAVMVAFCRPGNSPVHAKTTARNRRALVSQHEIDSEMTGCPRHDRCSLCWRM